MVGVSAVKIGGCSSWWSSDGILLFGLQNFETFITIPFIDLIRSQNLFKIFKTKISPIAKHALAVGAVITEDLEWSVIDFPNVFDWQWSPPPDPTWEIPLPAGAALRTFSKSPRLHTTSSFLRTDLDGSMHGNYYSSSRLLYTPSLVGLDNAGGRNPCTFHTTIYFQSQTCSCWPEHLPDQCECTFWLWCLVMLPSPLFPPSLW